MFQRLLGSRIAHADPQVRAKAFSHSDIDQQTLSEHLLTEKDADVLCVILARSNDVPKILEHATSSGPSSIATVARAALLGLAQQANAADRSTWSKLYQMAVAENWPQLEAFVDTINSAAGFEDHTLGALDVHRDSELLSLPENLLKSLVLNSQSSVVRQEAASQLSDIGVIESCCEEVKDRDKTVYRTLKARIDVHRKTEQQAGDIAALAEQVANFQGQSVIAQNDVIAVVNAKMQQLVDAHQHIEPVESNVSAYKALDRTLQQVRDNMQQKIVEARRHVDHRSELFKAMDEEHDRLSTVATAQASENEKPETGVSTVDLVTKDAEKSLSIDDVRSQWQKIPDHTEAEQKLFASVLSLLSKAAKEREKNEQNNQAALDALQNWQGQVESKEPTQLLKTIEAQWQTLNLSKDQRELLSARYQQLVRNVERRQQSLAHSQQQNTENLLQLMHQLSSSAADGDLKKAISLHDKLRARLSKVEIEKNARSKIEKTLKSVHPKLDEYRKWRHFGTQQVRENLIGQANQLLVEPPASPKKLADQIKALREAWKKLDQDDGRASEKSWLAFNSVCKEAYKPAKKHFNTLSKERKANYKEKREIITQLQALYNDTDWQAPDWSAVTEALKDLRLKWSKSGSVDFKVKKELYKEYQDINLKIDAWMQEERDSEIERRKLMISRLKSQHENDELSVAINSAKKMQRQWRPTVQSARKTEQTLWEEFRGICDTIFGKLKEESDAAKAAWQSDLSEREALCEELATLLKEDASDVAPNAARGRVNEIKKRWSAHSSIPKPVMSKVEKHYRQALKDFESRLKVAKKELARRNNQLVKHMFGCVQKLEALVTKGDDTSSQIESIKTDWNQHKNATGPTAKLLSKRFAVALNAINGDQKSKDSITKSTKSALVERKSLCLLGELIADLPSPSEFQDERKTLQLSRLKEAMQGGALEPREELQQLLNRWYSLGFVDDDHWPALQQRFDAILKAASAH